MENARRYLLSLLAIISVSLAAIGGANLLVDPYGIWNLATLARLNGNRPEEIFHDRMYKAHEVWRTHPDAVLLGTSRTQVGLDPKSKAFEGLASRVVNSALSDGQPWEAWRYLQHAEGLSHVKLAVMGLDYLSFDVAAKPNVEYVDARLSTDAQGRPQRLSPLVDVVPTLLSETALRASLHTVRKQQEPSYFFEGGQRNPVFMQARQDEQGGMRKAMLFSERDYLGDFACYTAADEGGYSRTLADLAKLVATAKASGTALRLFFSPSHARSQLVIQEAGLWPSLEEWKRAIVEVVASEGQGADVQVWDFTGAGRYTAEEVPPLDDEGRRMRWYWESSHYTSALGDRVLARMLGQPGPAEAAGFGVRLTRANIEDDVTRVRDELTRYRSLHPDDAAEVAALAAQILPAARAAKRCRPPAGAQSMSWHVESLEIADMQGDDGASR